MSNRGDSTITPKSENPFESPKVVDEDPVVAAIVETPRRKKKDLAPTSVVMSMTAALFLSPLAPLALSLLAIPFSFAVVGTITLGFVLLFVRQPLVRWLGMTYFGLLIPGFVLSMKPVLKSIPPGYEVYAPLGIVFSFAIVLMLMNDSAKTYYRNDKRRS